MFEGRAEQVDLISLLSTGEARGANSLLWMCLICVKDVAASVFTSELCCLIVGESFFPAYPAERFCAKWEGEGDVDYDMFAKECTVERRHSGKDVSERHHPSRAELGLFYRLKAQHTKEEIKALENFMRLRFGMTPTAISSVWFSQYP